MTNVPQNLQDAKDILTSDGFAVGNTWYHGTSSELLASIKQQGLKRSGDKALKQTAKKIMATIGNQYTETTEPVFLTQSKQLAYYWAQQKVHERSVHCGSEASPVVLAVSLPEELKNAVKPDVGAASLLLAEDSDFLQYVAHIYQEMGLVAPDMDPMRSDRLEYLNKLGMAYIDADIDAQYVEALGEV